MRILIGYLIDGKTSGIDKYLLTILPYLEPGNQIDFLTNHKTKELADALKPHPVGIIQIPSLKHPLKQYRFIKKLCRKKQYDTAYFNISEAYNCMGILAAKKAGVKNVIVHSHNSQAGGKSAPERWIRKTCHRLCRPIVANKASCFAACSNIAGEWLYPDCVRHSGRYHVIYNAVPVDKFAYKEEVRNRVRAELHLEDKLVIGHVGSYNYAKNPFFLLQIMKEVLKNHSNAVMLAVGDGADRPLVMKKAEEMGLLPHIRFLGSRSDVPELLQAMDFFVLPSRFEGHPIAAIEAQIAGLKVIISDKVSKEAEAGRYCFWAPIDGDGRRWAEIINREYPYERLNIYENLEIVSQFSAENQKKQIRELFKNRG